MNILLLGAGGAGGNILRSLKSMFRRDLAVAEKADAKYADRLRRAVTTRFLDTNEFSLGDIPPEERLLIGSADRRFGSRHDPTVARAALEESREEVEGLISRYGVVVVIASGGKGTGAGTIFPLAEMARRQRKLVIPIFVRPSFERHEVEKKRYDEALRIAAQFDAAKIRLIEILNERGYVETDPQPQSVVWERMNRPIARGLRGLLYVLSDLSQVDPSDLSALFAGEGRLRMGFAEINPAPGREPSEEQVDVAARTCFDSSYYAFEGAVGTSLICIQGDWSNIVDARIKSRLAALAVGDAVDHPYNPLYARSAQTPRPWGVSAVFSEYTGDSAPLDLDWRLPQRSARPARAEVSAPLPVSAAAEVSTPMREPDPSPTDIFPSEGAPGPAAGAVKSLRHRSVDHRAQAEAHPGFSTMWEFAVALNRQNPEAVAIAGGPVDPEISVDGVEVRRLLTMVWFRSAFERLSDGWRDRLLDALIDAVVIPAHVLKHGRAVVQLRTLSYAEIRELFSKTPVGDPARADLELLLAIGRLWGEEAVGRVRFSDSPKTDGPSKLGSLLHGFRL